MGTPGVSAASKASHRAHHGGPRNPCSHVYPRCLEFSFSYLILSGPNSRLALMGPHYPSSPWEEFCSCSCFLPPQLGLASPLPTHVVSMSYLQSLGVREKSEGRQRPQWRKPGQGVSGGKCVVTYCANGDPGTAFQWRLEPGSRQLLSFFPAQASGIL